METHHNPIIRKIVTAKRKVIKKKGITALKRKALQNKEVSRLLNKKKRKS